MIVKLFYVLALIAFLKNAPKFIDELFGTTISKGSDTKSVHQLLSGIIGGGATPVAGGISGAVAAGKTGKNIAKGAISGAWAGSK